MKALELAAGLVLANLFLPNLGATTVVFGGGAFEMEFVEIAGGGVADDTGFGAVPYDYQIGRYAVSRAMVDTYNSLSGGPSISVSTLGWLSVPARPQMPAFMDWNEAARFVNWLNTSQGYAPAYRVPSSGGSSLNIMTWEPGDAGYDPSNPIRNANAVFVLASEDEWYRAAFYDPVADIYWEYATGSNELPAAVSGGSLPNTLVYNQPVLLGPADVNSAGGFSPFGTMGQTGNSWEWTESAAFPPNTPDQLRVFRGGSWNLGADELPSSVREQSLPNSASLRGLRIVRVPEPSHSALLGMGILVGCLLRSRTTL